MTETTTTAVTPEVRTLRASHRRVIQLFRTYGPMSDAEAFDVAKADGWKISPSGLRSRRAELTPPRGQGIRDTGKKRSSALGVRGAIVWELDPTVDEPSAGRA